MPALTLLLRKSKPCCWWTEQGKRCSVELMSLDSHSENKLLHCCKRLRLSPPQKTGTSKPLALECQHSHPLTRFLMESLLHKGEATVNYGSVLDSGNVNCNECEFFLIKVYYTNYYELAGWTNVKMTAVSACWRVAAHTIVLATAVGLLANSHLLQHAEAPRSLPLCCLGSNLSDEDFSHFEFPTLTWLLLGSSNYM